MEEMCLDQVHHLTDNPDASVQKLVFSWNDPSALPMLRRETILRQKLQGCFYINPVFEVHCPVLTPEFLAKARKCQAAWFRLLDRQFPGGGWRKKMEITRDIRQRQAEFTGILIIHALEADPQDWIKIETILGIRPEIIRRPEAFRLLENRDWDALKQISRAELAQHLARGPGHCAFVTPGISVLSAAPSPAFFSEADTREAKWHGALYKLFGNRAKHDLMSQADWPTRMLVFNGTLAVGDALYLPGRWPHRPLDEKRLRTSPFGTRTVPPEYLGLTTRAAPAKEPSLSSDISNKSTLSTIQPRPQIIRCLGEGD